jgi:phenylacetate-CoA ligase
MFKLNQGFQRFYDLLPSWGRDLSASAYAGWSGLKKYGGAYPYWRRLLDESQWWTTDQLREFQRVQLAGLFQFVHEACPFYRERLPRQGGDWEKMDPFEWLRQMPVIDRAVVRDHYDQIRTRRATDRRLMLSTSGTTGAALHVPLTSEALQREYAFRWQYYAIAGAKRGSRFAFFQGHMVVPVSRHRPPFHVRNYAENSLFFSLYHMADSSLGHYVKALNDFAPAYYYGYPSALYVLACFLRSQGLAVPQPKAVFTASEMLHDFQKDIIEQCFQAPIYQWYGQVETTANLHECDKHRLHIKEEYGLVELITDDGKPARPGEPASAVATGWGNRAFPLIRYDTGDNMILSEETRCPCGRGGRIIERIMGRDDDILLTPEGRYIGRLDFVFKAVDTVKESQIVQEDLRTVVVKVVPAAGYSSRDEGIIADKLRERIGKSMTIRVERVDQIPRLAGGKFRYVVSKVKGKLLDSRAMGS